MNHRQKFKPAASLQAGTVSWAVLCAMALTLWLLPPLLVAEPILAVPARIEAAGGGAAADSVSSGFIKTAFFAPGSRAAGSVQGEWGHWSGLAARGALALLTLPVLFWLCFRPRTVNRIDGPGFEVINPKEHRQFIPLEDRYQAMDFVSKIKTKGSLRLSANLNKVTLSIRRFGYLMEDKNYRNALLVNRRRVRRTLLRNGDVLDLGDLTLLYRDLREPQIIRHASVTPAEGKSQIKFDRPKGPVRKGTPMLTSEQLSNRPFYLTKNVIYIGRSESNDLVIKSRAVYYRHAKVEKVGGRYKLQDLSILGNTFVNNRRVEQRFLKDGDEISIEMHRFRFQIVSRPTRERHPATGPAQHDADIDSGGGDNGGGDSSEEIGDTLDDQDAASSS